MRQGSVDMRDARRLMCLALSISFEKLILRLNDELEGKAQDEYLRLCQRFKDGEPFEYISGVCEFYGRKFCVNTSVLIPRPETEILVQKSLGLASKFKSPRIFDIGTGSGIIAITLALELPKAKIIATDISKSALDTAKSNAKKLGATNISFIQSDLLLNISEYADIIVSNPPYIANDYPLDINVLKEPRSALFGGERGDEILIKLINQAKNRCKYLACEIGFDQAQSMQEALQNSGFKASFYKDLAGFMRGFVAAKLD